MTMKSHLFCVGVEVGKSPSVENSFLSAHVNVYVGADSMRDALDRAEAALQRDGYQVTFVRGCWVVDLACNDGFCPIDELPGEISGGLLFSDAVHYGEFRELIRESDYGY